MQTVDLAIVGSGIASTATVINLLRKLIDGTAGREKMSIAIIEQYHEFWFGVPYGSRSSVNALTITSIADFLTAEKERNLFFDWFRPNKESLIQWYLSNGGATAAHWMETNSQLLASENWKNLYLPRFIFGRYLQSIIGSLLKTVEEKKLAEINLINAEAVDLSKLDGGVYQITLEMPDKTIAYLSAPKVVIATGSAPIKNIGDRIIGDDITYINNFYDPSAESSLKKLTTVIEATEDDTKRNLLIVGSNASSIELLYLLATSPNLIDSINKVILVSRSGLLPYHIIEEQSDSYICINLDQLKEAGNYTIEKLIDAATADIHFAVKDGVILPYIDRIISYTIELLQVLSEDDKKAFLGIYGAQLSNLFRRSGADYKNGEAILLRMQKLIMLKGGFAGIGKGGILNYTDPLINETNEYATPFSVVINCTGADNLEVSDSRLIFNLVHKNLCDVNLSGKGFYVNKRFEAAPNLYIMGPLLGGNMNKRIHFWHLENASRLLYLASFLADCLLEQ